MLLWIAGLVIPIGALALFYGFRALPAIELIVIAGASALVALYLLNVNLTAPHRLYRDRLAAAFIKKKEPTDPPEPPASVNSGNGALPHLLDAAFSRAAALIQKEPPDPPIPLTAINPGNSAPYHLLNAALNLPSSITPALRDRKCDFFLFSKHWCGSPIAGYHQTGKWLADNAPADLATAMAVSGAAVSPNMGLDSMPSLTALLTFLNVRLGFWIRHPDRPGPENPGFMCLVREMFGVQMAEDRAWLNLSDGAHIENTGVYELLRRRCKYIIGVDGESDPEFTFAGLMTLARHAQIDFGIRIEANLNQLKPDPKTNLSHVHYVLCRVHYPHEGPDRPAATGLLLYLKLSDDRQRTGVAQALPHHASGIPAPVDAGSVLRRGTIRGLPSARRAYCRRPVPAGADEQEHASADRGRVVPAAGGQPAETRGSRITPDPAARVPKVTGLLSDPIPRQGNGTRGFPAGAPDTIHRSLPP